jgi:hypothetical protein
MKLRCILAATAIIFFSCCASSGNGPGGEISSDMDMHEFIEGFYKENNTLMCAQALDSLRTMAPDNILDAG